MDVTLEKNACSLLGDLFQHVVSDMKRMMPVWEEFIVKTSKLSVSLRSTVVCLSSFLDTLQKIADIATGARGATKEIGSGLTRLCLRHRNIENKLKVYNSGLIDSMVSPIQEKLEEWKKTLLLLDKEHSKDQKKTKQELRKISTDVIALQNKVRKGKTEAKTQLDDALREAKNKTFYLEEFEKSAVRNALVEERTRFCIFISCLKPVMDMEVSVLAELTHVQEVVDSLCMQVGDPNSLPLASEQVIMDIQESKSNWFCQTPSGTPLSQNSSFQSINSGQSSRSGNSSPSERLESSEANQSAFQNVPFNAVMSSTSDDSGFVNHDLFGLTGSNSEKWKQAARQRSWTGLTQVCPTRDSLPPKAASPGIHIGSIRVPGRRKCPDINMVDDLPFRVSSHAHSLPPTPNPYAMPSLVGRTDEEKPLEKFFRDSGETSLSIGSQRASVDVVNLDPEAVTWSASHPMFEDEDLSFNCIVKNSSGLRNFSGLNESTHMDCIDTDELTAAMQELEWTTAMLDSIDDASLGKTEFIVQKESTKKDDSQSFPSADNNERSVPRSLSKPPISTGILRRSSMQGGARKPPPPIRRTSSMVGSPQLSFPGATPDDQPYNAPIDRNNYRQPQLSQRVSSMTTVAMTDNTALPTATAPKPSSASLGTLPTDDSRRGNGRKIPRMNRTASQPFGKTVPDEEKPPPVAQREKSRLPRRSLSDTHADIIQTLNEQFSSSPQTTVEKYCTARLAAVGSCGKLPNSGKPGMGKSPEASLGQIPEGVTLYRGMVIGPGVQKPSPVRFQKKAA